jgi:long-chain acyl-CoA synthetase
MQAVRRKGHGVALILTELQDRLPGEIALRDSRVALGWGAVNDTVNRVASAVAALPLRSERRIAVCAENAAETVLAYLGITYGGCSAIPISYHLTATEIAYILSDSRPDALIVSPAVAKKGVEAAELAGVPLVVGWRCDQHPAITDWDTWLAAADPGEPPADRAIANSIMYTSGTTGFPKAVELQPSWAARGASTAADYAAALSTEPLVGTGVHLVVGPLYHTGPIRSVRVLGAGVPVVVMEHFDPVALLEVIQACRVSTCLLVPTHFVRLLALPEEIRQRYDVSSLTFVVQTGSACPVDVKRRMIDWWGPIFQEGYGSTESRMVTTISSEEWLRKPGSVGRVVPPYVRGFAVDAAGRELPPGQVGVLYFEDSTGRGIEYRGDPEKTRAAHLAPGIFTLGEAGYVDEDGYIFVTDRVNDLIVSGGVNIYPAEAELVLATHPQVAEVIVIGVPDPDFGELPKALVVPCDPGAPPDPPELLAYCRERLSHFKCPRGVEFVDRLERSPMGKIAKHKIRARYWPDPLGGQAVDSGGSD